MIAAGLMSRHHDAADDTASESMIDVESGADFASEDGYEVPDRGRTDDNEAAPNSPLSSQASDGFAGREVTGEGGDGEFVAFSKRNGRPHGVHQSGSARSRKIKVKRDIGQLLAGLGERERTNGVEERGLGTNFARPPY